MHFVSNRNLLNLLESYVHLVKLLIKLEDMGQNPHIWGSLFSLLK